jgi:hypothetical protein
LETCVANLSRELADDILNIATCMAIVYEYDFIATASGSVEGVGE